MRAVVGVLMLTGCLWLAAPSSAAYYVGKGVAEHYTRVLLHQYGYSNISVYCRPKQGFNEKYNKGGRMLYHRWLCGYYSGEPGYSCKGAVSIIGSDGSGGFRYYRHFSRGEAC